jgi:dihydrofolate reductase
MGRNMFGPVRGPWGKDAWKGWWGDNPPFHHPVFVLTHHAREPLPMKGGTTFFFISGVESALKQARQATGGKDVMLGGGANVAQQYLAANLIDEIQIHLVPLLLGDGTHLFDNLDAQRVKLEPIRTIAGPDVTHLKYRFIK